MFAMDRPGSGFYFPSIEELLITGGIVSGFMFFYNVVVRLFPVMEKPVLHEELVISKEA
jgi:Ni/Fe-hydrogenase subunit HybB-like protein